MHWNFRALIGALEKIIFNLDGPVTNGMKKREKRKQKRIPRGLLLNSINIQLKLKAYSTEWGNKRTEAAGGGVFGEVTAVEWKRGFLCTVTCSLQINVVRNSGIRIYRNRYIDRRAQIQICSSKLF